MIMMIPTIHITYMVKHYKMQQSTTRGSFVQLLPQSCHHWRARHHWRHSINIDNGVLCNNLPNNLQKCHMGGERCRGKDWMEEGYVQLIHNNQPSGYMR